MTKKNVVYDRVREELFRAFPELWQRIESTFGSYYDLEKETPEAYPIFEDVVQKLVFELLVSGQNETLLTRLFLFFEELANSPDPNVHRDLLAISIIKPLVAQRENALRAWKYMGPRTKELARFEAHEQGRDKEPPFV